MYAVEASNMADCAEILVNHNDLSSKISIVKGKVEEVEIPEQVDVIISEPIGFLLVHERMLESFVSARDRFLKPGGKMYPSRGSILFSPLSDETIFNEHLARAAFWDQEEFYGVDVTPLKAVCVKEFFSQPTVGYFPSSSLLSSEYASYEVDFRSVTAEELQNFEIPFSFTIERTGIHFDIIIKL